MKIDSWGQVFFFTISRWNLSSYLAYWAHFVCLVVKDGISKESNKSKYARALHRNRRHWVGTRSNYFVLLTPTIVGWYPKIWVYKQPKLAYIWANNFVKIYQHVSIMNEIKVFRFPLRAHMRPFKYGIKCLHNFAYTRKKNAVMILNFILVMCIHLSAVAVHIKRFHKLLSFHWLFHSLPTIRNLRTPQ